jgi:WD40 repeat protein
LSLAFHPSSLVLISSSVDGSLGIHTFDSSQWRTVRKVVSHVAVTALCWHDDHLLIGTVNGTVGLWALANLEWQQLGEVQVHSGRTKLMVSLSNIPRYPIVSCGDDQRLKFLRIEGSGIALESELNAFPGPFEKIQYDHDKKVLRVACTGLPEYAWRFEADGKWRQSEDVN